MSIKQAIEALEELIEYAETAGFDWSLDNARAALAALRSMPAEPVGFMSEKQLALIEDPEGEHGRYIPMRKTPAGNFTFALYATPHTEAVRMSEAEIDEITEQQWGKQIGAMKTAYRAYARAVEQATAARLGVKLGDV